jgi:hypothetical protein
MGISNENEKLEFNGNRNDLSSKIIEDKEDKNESSNKSFGNIPLEKNKIFYFHEELNTLCKNIKENNDTLTEIIIDLNDCKISYHEIFCISKILSCVNNLSNLTFKCKDDSKNGYLFDENIGDDNDRKLAKILNKLNNGIFDNTKIVLEELQDCLSVTVNDDVVLHKMEYNSSLFPYIIDDSGDERKYYYISKRYITNKSEELILLYEKAKESFLSFIEEEKKEYDLKKEKYTTNDIFDTKKFEEDLKNFEFHKLQKAKNDTADFKEFYEQHTAADAGYLFCKENSPWATDCSLSLIKYVSYNNYENYQEHTDSPMYSNFFKRYYKALSYKIHLQIHPDYLVDFIIDFSFFIKTICDIYAYKVFRGNFFDVYGGKHLPVIVIYPYLIPGTKKERNKILRKIILTIQERYGKVASRIGLRYEHGMKSDYHKENVCPRYNMKIDDLIYIAGGNGDEKKRSYSTDEQAQQDGWSNKDKYFFKGFEYEHEASTEQKTEELKDKSFLDRIKRSILMHKVKAGLLLKKMRSMLSL